MADSAGDKENTSAAKSKGEKRSAQLDGKDESTTSIKKQKLSSSGSGKEATLEKPISEKRSITAVSNDEVQDNSTNSFKKMKLDNSNNGRDDGYLKDEQNAQKKPYHRRMKHTLNAVLEQMEFYFGDSSLSKDRFLKTLVDSSPDGYVDLCVFGNFNKLQALHKDGISRDVLIQAVSRSTMLQLNEDKTKVRRVTPLKEMSQEDIDRRTVYVEHLPSHATHTWVKQIFSQCGKVAYVSLPTFKTSKQIKGFAFVEFDTADEAEKACAMLNNPPPDKAMDRPGKFPKGNKTLDRLHKLAPPLPTPDTMEENSQIETKEDTSKSASESEGKKKKKKKTKKKKPQETSVEDNPVTTDSSAKDQKSNVKKKKKKKKRKLSQSQEQGSGTEGLPKEEKEQPIAETKDNKVLSEGDKAEVEESSEKPGAETSAGDKPIQGLSEKSEEELPASENTSQAKKRKKKKKKNKSDKTNITEAPQDVQEEDKKLQVSTMDLDGKGNSTTAVSLPSSSSQEANPDRKLSHKERKMLRQEDIRRKRQQRLDNSQVPDSATGSGDSVLAQQTATEDDERKQDGSQPTSILKLKKAAEKKRVEFDPVPITTEFVEAKGARKRKKSKREKSHLRVISKQEWMRLKEDYIRQQKSHMQALKESLRELRQQECSDPNQSRAQPANRVDLEDVFGTKPLKLSHEMKMAHVEKMKFTPNVIVQWWCTHEMHRDKIRTMFKETHANSIAYIDANEEARSGHIRFKDEASAEEFAKMSRNSTTFMARVLPADQQEEYWEKANRDRLQKLGRKKKEQGANRIARQVFQRNKATFFNKPSRIVFDEAENEDENNDDVKSYPANDSSNVMKAETALDKTVATN